MYRCEKCGVVVPPRHKLNRVVVETREKEYPVFRPRKGKKRRNREAPEPIRFARGTEIVKELRVCANCASALLAEQGDDEVVEVA